MEGAGKLNTAANPDIQGLSAECRRLLELAQERFQVELLLLEELKGGRTLSMAQAMETASQS